MKRFLATSLFTVALTCLGAASARADLIWYEGFNYPDGNVTNTSGGLWISHNGPGGAAAMFVKNHKLEVSGNSSTNAPRQDDDHRNFCIADCPYTNGAQVVYASFTINCTNLPTAVSNYIAHFYVNSSTFHGRVHAMLGTLPGTWRLGISGASTPVSKIFPVDLAPNTDYQVVVGWDPTSSDVPPLFSDAATLWINPVSSADTSVTSGDSVTTPPASVGYAFRQAAGTTSFFAVITNLAVATTFDEAATNVWSNTPVAPTIINQPRSVTNFVGVPVLLSVVVNGQSLGDLTYQWRKDGVEFFNPAGNTNVYSIASLANSDVAQYDVVIANPITSLSVTSQVAYVAIDTNQIPPFFVKQPASAKVFSGQTATFSVAAAGPQPITYQWFYNGSPATGPNVSGADTPTVTIANVLSNNATTGSYFCAASNQYGGSNSITVTLSVTNPPIVNISFLRGLVDSTFFLPTNTTAYYTVTNVIVTASGAFTALPNAEFFVQDGTGGIAVFVANGGSTMFPAAGDRVNVTGPLSHFNSLLQFNLDASDLSHVIVTNSHNNPLPAGVVLPFSFTNGIGFGGVSNVIHQYEGMLVTFTNVYFTTGFDGTNTFPSGTTTMTNITGGTFRFFLNSSMSNIIGQTIPPFAWTVTGPMSYFLSATDTNRSSGFEFDPTRFEDIVSTAAPPTATITVTNTKALITWVAQPYVGYSILSATNVTGPYLPLTSSELTFTNTLGQYLDIIGTTDRRFYKISSP
jgi:hypothetical protein